MSIRHTCQGSPQQSSTSNCVACDLSGVGTGQVTANYGQPYGAQPGVEARRLVQPHGHAVHPDVAWMNQTLSSAPRNPFGWYEEPLNDRYGIQGGVAPPGEDHRTGMKGQRLTRDQVPDTRIQLALPYPVRELLHHQLAGNLTTLLRTRQPSVNNILLTSGKPSNAGHLLTTLLVSRGKL
ncbi:hypothetical protein KC318_g7750 [Hortaea werneckii]|nr:hypothetical protein KC334_g7884 [Hortaea werneckii]KAI7006075.1 hypothetical protein KC355_g7921 [Hortaea werneckii]KAI7188985.1 hypothetical protein KC324_g6445 [Hortaea werneckii]KAI7578761.1 hypothetical protein KC316_g9727 [Hortaea werneckii]KAI7664391.1 hypothetical protein KC318_g7750 [Hortaea werneckii]